VALRDTVAAGTATKLVRAIQQLRQSAQVQKRRADRGASATDSQRTLTDDDGAGREGHRRHRVDHRLDLYIGDG
jgi:hypothetical protein